MSELLLGVNIDHIATLRNVRGGLWPDPIQAAFIAEQAGADIITVHLREDRRHINDRDVRLLSKIIQTNMNLEMATTEEIVNLACQIKPQYCCLVPENRQEITTECGLNVHKQKNKLRNIISRLHDFGIRVSLFIDTDEEQIIAAASIGADCIEIHTGAYANATNDKMRASEFSRIELCAKYAVTHGLKVNAGHGLNYHNVKPFVALTQVQELNIGHAIISRSIISGLSKAVKDMKQLIHRVYNY